MQVSQSVAKCRNDFATDDIFISHLRSYIKTCILAPVATVATVARSVKTNFKRLYIYFFIFTVMCLPFFICLATVVTVRHLVLFAVKLLFISVLCFIDLSQNRCDTFATLVATNHVLRGQYDL
jgi:hypothetical protein